MKGGAVFLPDILSKKLVYPGGLAINIVRSLAGMSQPTDPGFARKTSEIYLSPRRMILIEEVVIPLKSPEVGNLHALLIELPETTGKPTYTFLPDIPQNIFRGNAGNLAVAINEGRSDYGGKVHVLVDKEAASSSVKTGQLTATEQATGRLPEAVQQGIAAMAGLTDKPSTTLPSAVSGLKSGVEAERKADAIVDAAIAWVKAWNAEHVAGKGEKKAATAARVAAENALKQLQSQPVGGKARRKKTRRSKTRASRRTSPGQKTRRT